MNTTAAAAFAARSTTALAALRALAAEDRAFTAADLERADRLVAFIERVYGLTWKADDRAWKGFATTESIFHDRAEARVSRKVILDGMVEEEEEEEDDDAPSTAVRVITDGGELVRYTEHGDSEAAWEDFEAAVTALRVGEIAQLIEDDMIAAEHNPEYHGPAPLDVTDYS